MSKETVLRHAPGRWGSAAQTALLARTSHRDVRLVRNSHQAPAAQPLGSDEEGAKPSAVILSERSESKGLAAASAIELRGVRAPTLHRLGIQAFEPVLIDGKALRLHPLVCEAYNADFDGDQMAIHVPLSEEAQAEARLLLLAAEHILNPKDGKPVVTPSQDMVLGNYYLTMEEEGREGEGMVFKDIDEAVMAYRNGYVHLHSRVGIAVDSMPDKPWKENQLHKILVTTVGKILFNSIIPAEIPYLQETTNENLTDSTPDKYFLEPGQDIQTVIDSLEINAQVLIRGTFLEGLTLAIRN